MPDNRELPSVLFEELLEDTKALTASVIRWGDRWSTYGDQLRHLASDSQIAEIDRVTQEFIIAVRKMGGEV